MIWEYKKRPTGFSLTEMIVAVAVLSVLVVFLVTSFRFINKLSRQAVYLKFEKEAQVHIYEITREVKNAREIVRVTPTSLIIRAFNEKLGPNPYDPAESPLFEDVNVGTITYQYRETSEGSFIEKTIYFPAVSSVGFSASTSTKKILRNFLADPGINEDEPGKSYEIFRPFRLSGTSGDTGDVIEKAVEVRFRLEKGFFKEDPKEFSARAMKRNQVLF